MGSLNINMPDDLRAYIDHRTREGGFGTPTEYVRHLIRRDRDEEAQRRLERLLLEGLQSGTARGGGKGLFKRLHKRGDELGAERKGRAGEGKPVPPKGERSEGARGEGR